MRRIILDRPENLAPAFGYSNSFDLPNDALYIWRVQRDGFDDLSNGNHGNVHGIPWSVENDKLLCDYEKVFVRYISTLNSETIGSASNQFVDVLSLRLAVEFCMPLTENATMQQALMAEYQQRLIDASSIDGGQASREMTRSSNLNGARFGGFRGGDSRGILEHQWQPRE